MKKLFLTQTIKFWYNGYVLGEKLSKLIFDIIYCLYDFDSLMKYLILKNK